LSDPASAGPNFTAPEVLATTTLEFLLSVTDTGGLSSNDSVIVTVTDTPVVQFSVGGTISGNNAAVTLSLNGTEESFTNSPFAFSQSLNDGEDYDVHFVSIANSQSCSIANNNGTANANITDIAVNCTTNITSRVTSLSYDYDNNGLTDATDIISYDQNGRAVTSEYVYNGDGTADLVNLRDEDVSVETNNLTYDNQNRVILFTVDRSDQRIENNLVYDTEGLLTMVEFELFDANNNPFISSNWVFTYSAGQLDNIDNFLSTNNQLLTSQRFTYGLDDLPETVSFTSSGVNAVSTFGWRSDGQLEALESISDNNAISAVNVLYDNQGRQQSQLWNNSGLGFSYSEILTENYTRTTSYDAQNRPIKQSYDLGSDGVIDATVTIEWEQASCLPAFLWAPNGFPNFVKDAARPFVPGTGFFGTQFCNP
jgi:hypothetical protein